MVSNSNIKQKLENLKTGKFSCKQNVKDFLSNIDKNNKKYNVFLELNKNALKRAEELDKKREKKEKNSIPQKNFT